MKVFIFILFCYKQYQQPNNDSTFQENLYCYFNPTSNIVKTENFFLYINIILMVHTFQNRSKSITVHKERTHTNKIGRSMLLLSDPPIPPQFQTQCHQIQIHLYIIPVSGQEREFYTSVTQKVTYLERVCVSIHSLYVCRQIASSIIQKYPCDVTRQKAQKVTINMEKNMKKMGKNAKENLLCIIYIQLLWLWLWCI